MTREEEEDGVTIVRNEVTCESISDTTQTVSTYGENLESLQQQQKPPSGHGQDEVTFKLSKKRWLVLFAVFVFGITNGIVS